MEETSSETFSGWLIDPGAHERIGKKRGIPSLDRWLASHQKSFQVARLLQEPVNVLPVTLRLN
jgi:hypothetical protein